MPAGLRSAPVYDPVLRLLHWVNALLVTVLLASGLAVVGLGFGAPAGPLRHWHGIFGNALVVGLLGRLLWGVLGPEHGRWHSMWQPRAWFEAWRKQQFFSVPTRFGHHPVASAAYLSAYSLLVVLAVSGIALLAIKSGHGPLSPWLGWHFAYKHWVLLPHQLAAYALLLFVTAHLSALVLHQHLHGLPFAQSMVTGIQYLPEQSS